MIGAHIEMANQAAAFFFVVSGNAVMLHPVFEGPPQNGDKLWLEQTVRHVENVMASGAVIANCQAIFFAGYGELYLIAVALGLLCTKDWGQLQRDTASPGAGVLDPLSFGALLPCLTRGPVLPSAASPCQGTVNIQTFRGGGQQADAPAPGDIGFYL